MTSRGVDLASYQGAPNFDAMKLSGIEFAITKVTEGTSYAFPGHRRNRSEAQRTGMVAGLYHFAKAGDPAAEARFFLGAAGPLVDGEFLCLDWETSYSDPVAWCSAWLSTVQSQTGLRPLIYLNESTVRRYDWGPIARSNFALWLAKYDGSTNVVTAPHWGQPTIKQYTDKGRVPGIAGAVDLDVYFGDILTLRRFGANVAAVPSLPAPTASALPELKEGDHSPAVETLHRFLNRYDWKPPLPLLPVGNEDGAQDYGPRTVAVVAAAQRQCGILTGDGRNTGPQTRAAFFARGWRV